MTLRLAKPPLLGGAQEGVSSSTQLDNSGALLIPKGNLNKTMSSVNPQSLLQPPPPGSARKSQISPS